MGLFNSLFSKKQEKNLVQNEVIKIIKPEISLKSIDKIQKNKIEFSFILSNDRQYVLFLQIDDFTGEKTIKFSYMASYIYDKICCFADELDFLRIGYGIRSLDFKDLIYFDTYQKTVKFKKGDTITFLFDDEFKIDFELIENGYRIDKDSDGVVIESYSEISKETIYKFKTTEVIKWRYNPKVGKPIVGTIGKDMRVRTMEMFKVYSYFFENDLMAKAFE